LTSEDDQKKFDAMIEGESQKSKGLQFCPECGSTRLYYFLGLYAGHNYVCKDCGYQGPVIIEDGQISKELRKKKIKEIKEKNNR